MFPDFLSPAINNLTEPTSIALAQRIQRTPIATPLSQQPIDTAFVRQGQGHPPILLLHGFDSSVFEFRRLLPWLCASCETQAVDLLGFGFTDRLAIQSFTCNDIKTHLYNFWETEISRPIVLVGTSMGGAAAIDFTLTYPDVVEKLVLIGSAGLSNGPIVGKFLVPPFDYLAAEFLRRPQVRNSISRTAYYDTTLNSLDAKLCAALHLAMPGWHQAMISFTKSGGYGSFRDRLPQLDLPTLILWGENDRILGTQDAVKFEKAIVNSQLVWIERCGHVPHLEQPQITARHILEFLA
jgi:pimeloyl-ACP methyl ester carboxylesterase